MRNKSYENSLIRRDAVVQNRRQDAGAVSGSDQQAMAYQAMADNSQQVKQSLTYQAMADSHSRQPSPVTNNSQGVVQRASAYQVENVIGYAKSPAAAAKQTIVDEITEQTGKEHIGHDDERNIGTPWVTAKAEVKKAALDMGYTNETATRLVERKPFTKNDIQALSTLESGSVTSFDNLFSHMTPINHQVYFNNDFNNGKWKMSVNYRNPYLADFFASDAVAEQKKFYEKQVEEGKATTVPGELTTLTRSNVVSNSGKRWARENKIVDGKLSPENLHKFLTKTENGSHSAQVAKGMKKEIVGGTVSGMKNYQHFTVDLDCVPITAKEEGKEQEKEKQGKKKSWVSRVFSKIFGKK